VVPPRSDRISRVPPYSSPSNNLYPYGTVTLYGTPFQTLPVDCLMELAWSAFARHY
jgi:hypothetical protein